MNFKKQLGTIRARAAMRQAIDELDDKSLAIVIIQGPKDAEGNSDGHYIHYGDVTKPQILWLVEKYKQWLLSPEG